MGTVVAPSDFSFSAANPDNLDHRLKWITLVGYVGTGGIDKMHVIRVSILIALCETSRFPSMSTGYILLLLHTRFHTCRTRVGDRSTIYCPGAWPLDHLSYFLGCFRVFVYTTSCHVTLSHCPHCVDLFSSNLKCLLVCHVHM